jgi:putative FmdB family regulatory protein
MPTYEYACTSCSNEWEAEQSIKDAALTNCPRCNHATARRQISRGTGFILKGSGWYSDLYASSSNKKPDTGGDKGSSGSGDSGGSSSGSSGSSSSPSSGSSGGSSSGGGSSDGSPSGTSTPTAA